MEKVIEKRDLKKELRNLYGTANKGVVEVFAPSMNFLMIDGEGNPNASQDYADAVEALFSASYAAKFMVKKSALAIDYGVMPLEGLWWADDMTSFSADEKSKWKWTMMIMQPSFAPPEIIEAAIGEAQKKKNLAAFAALRFESFTEGKCAQILHLGPFSEEKAAIERLHAFIDAKSARRGKHHEIYLSDIRKAAPANWKTIIRQPME